MYQGYLPIPDNDGNINTYEDCKSMVLFDSDMKPLVDEIKTSLDSWNTTGDIATKISSHIEDGVTTLGGILFSHKECIPDMVEHSKALLDMCTSNRIMNLGCFGVWGKEVEISKYLLKGMRKGFAKKIEEGNETVDQVTVDIFEDFHSSVERLRKERDEIVKILEKKDPSVLIGDHGDINIIIRENTDDLSNSKKPSSLGELD